MPDKSRAMRMMCAGVGLLITLVSITPLNRSAAHTEPSPDVFWLDKYGNIAWEDEKARLDNFAIQLMNNPNDIGYLYVQAGRLSCKGEAQARAVRAKNYMTKVRHADWNRIIWRDIGFGDDFEVSIWLAPRGKPPMSVPVYERPTAQHAIKNCGSDFLRFNRGAKQWRPYPYETTNILPSVLVSVLFVDTRPKLAAVPWAGRFRRG